MFSFFCIGGGLKRTETTKPTRAAVVQLDRTSVYETEGQEFESLQPRQV